MRLVWLEPREREEKGGQRERSKARSCGLWDQCRHVDFILIHKGSHWRVLSRGVI